MTEKFEINAKNIDGEIIQFANKNQLRSWSKQELQVWIKFQNAVENGKIRTDVNTRRYGELLFQQYHAHRQNKNS